MLLVVIGNLRGMILAADSCKVLEENVNLCAIDEGAARICPIGESDDGAVFIENFLDHR